jgi:hypothetical protein
MAAARSATHLECPVPQPLNITCTSQGLPPARVRISQIVRTHAPPTPQHTQPHHHHTHVRTRAIPVSRAAIPALSCAPPPIKTLPRPEAPEPTTFLRTYRPLLPDVRSPSASPAPVPSPSPTVIQYTVSNSAGCCAMPSQQLRGTYCWGLFVSHMPNVWPFLRLER